MTTPLNRIQNVSRTAPLHVIAGHGTLIANKPRVPPNTYIIFLAKPGYALSASTLFYPELYREDFLRGLLQNKHSTRINSLKTWKTRIYFPGNPYPNLILDTYDYPTSKNHKHNSEMNELFGVYTVNTGVTRSHGLKHILLSHLIGKKTGIFFVAACRTGSVRSVQRNENTQRLRTRGTRTYSAATVRRNANEPPAKRPRTTTFTFHPGVSPVRVLGSQPATRRRKPGTRAR